MVLAKIFFKIEWKDTSNLEFSPLSDSHFLISFLIRESADDNAEEHVRCMFLLFGYSAMMAVLCDLTIIAPP